MIPLADIDYDHFKTTFPEFNEIIREKVEFYLEFSKDLLNIGEWTHKYYGYAVFLLTAHRLYLRFDLNDEASEGESKIRGGFSTLGTTQSRSASSSSLSESYAISALATSNDPVTVDLSKTAYGQELLSLIWLIIPAGNIVVSPETV